MTNFQNIILLISLLFPSVATGGTNTADKALVSVENRLSEPREEMVEIEASRLPQGQFRILGPGDTEIPWQRTYDGKVIFPASVGPKSKVTYRVENGRPAVVDPVCLASFYPDREDDLAWENDYAAYRAYGPALGAHGGSASGYDVFTKSTTRPVMPERYFKEIVQKVSYHADHGDGMDVYDVGPTLGGGGSAVISPEGKLILPGVFSSYRILDNGPLRTTFELVYEYGGGRETRIITLDAGTPFNRTTCTFSGFTADSVCAGTVVHKPAEQAYIIGEDFVAYSDPTSAPSGRGIGRIFTGVVNPSKSTRTCFRPLEKPAGKAIGHLLTITPANEAAPLTYHWGSCWNKGRILSFDSWVNRLQSMSRRLKSPLIIKITDL